MKVVVSIHDVTPALEEPVRRLWALCASHGVAPALLLVPDWHGRWPLARFPDFVRWVRGCADERGAELFLHGERHDEWGLRRRWRDHLRAVGRTAAEGEFLTLDAAAAGERIDRGLALLHRLHLPPVGFVPPAWLAREDTFRAVAARGLAVSEDARWIRLHAPERRIPAPVVRWSARAPLRARVSAVVASRHVARHRRHAVTRIALHPSDLRRDVTTRSLERTLATLLEQRRAVGYMDLRADGRG